MGKTDERIDLYIAKSADFAHPILAHLRELVHSACPDVEETMKWSFPHFLYSGEILCSMASFKKHCSFGFWKASIMTDPHGLLQTVGKTAMGHMGQITDLSEIPPDKILREYIKEAARLNKEGIKLPSRQVGEKKKLAVPNYFLDALKKNKAAVEKFKSFSTSAKNEYVEWITEAKTDDTRNKRLQTALEWIAEGKGRHWKYQRDINTQ